MEKQLIISLGREFGSGGHVIAQKLAERYQIPLYDRDLLEKIASEKNINSDDFEKYDEKRRNPFLTRTVRGYSNSPEENIARMQFDFIKRKAAAGDSFVIVGRCAETILKENPYMISIYHNYYCERKWGDSRNYDLSINSSKLGLEETTRIVIEYIDSRYNLNSQAL